MRIRILWGTEFWATTTPRPPIQFAFPQIFPSVTLLRQICYFIREKNFCRSGYFKSTSSPLQVHVEICENLNCVHTTEKFFMVSFRRDLDLFRCVSWSNHSRSTNSNGKYLTLSVIKRFEKCSDVFLWRFTPPSCPTHRDWIFSRVLSRAQNLPCHDFRLGCSRASPFVSIELFISSRIQPK
jgi:hypothetical protein